MKGVQVTTLTTLTTLPHYHTTTLLHYYYYHRPSFLRRCRTLPISISFQFCFFVFIVTESFVFESPIFLFYSFSIFQFTRKSQVKSSQSHRLTASLRQCQSSVRFRISYAEWCWCAFIFQSFVPRRVVVGSFFYFFHDSRLKYLIFNIFSVYLSRYRSGSPTSFIFHDIR